MSRAIHGLVAVTTVVLASLPLASSAAGATATVTTRAAAAAPQEFDEDWGPYYSLKKGSYRAKASGSASEDGDSIHVTGRVYDKHSSANICGYLQTKFVNEDDETRYVRVYNCTYGTPLWFDHYWDDVSTASVRVCLWNQSEGQRLKCGQWYEVYSSDNGDEEEEEEE